MWGMHTDEPQFGESGLKGRSRTYRRKRTSGLQEHAVLGGTLYEWQAYNPMRRAYK